MEIVDKKSDLIIQQDISEKRIATCHIEKMMDNIGLRQEESTKNHEGKDYAVKDTVRVRKKAIKRVPYRINKEKMCTIRRFRCHNNDRLEKSQCFCYNTYLCNTFSIDR